MYFNLDTIKLYAKLWKLHLQNTALQYDHIDHILKDLAVQWFAKFIE